MEWFNNQIKKKGFYICHTVVNPKLQIKEFMRFMEDGGVSNPFIFTVGGNVYLIGGVSFSKMGLIQYERPLNKIFSHPKSSVPEDDSWYKDWEKANTELHELGGVNLYAYRLGWLAGNKAK